MFTKYSTYCASCHEEGKYGAPQRRNIESWEKYPRNLLTLTNLAIEGKGADLIASVANWKNKFAWTGHRNNKIIFTDSELNITKEITLKKSNLVGVSFLDSNNLLILNRLNPNRITVINLKNLKKVSFELSWIKDLYDIEVFGQCVYFSSRSLGKIYVFSTKDLTKKKN